MIIGLKLIIDSLNSHPLLVEIVIKTLRDDSRLLVLSKIAGCLPKIAPNPVTIVPTPPYSSKDSIKHIGCIFSENVSCLDN